MIRLTVALFDPIRRGKLCDAFEFRVLVSIGQPFGEPFRIEPHDHNIGFRCHVANTVTFWGSSVAPFGTNMVTWS